MIHIDERSFQWVYPATAAAGLLLVLFLPASSSVVPAASKRTYAILQLTTLLGAILGAKLAFLSGDLDWPFAHVTWQEVVFSGRSITGGLLGGFLAAEGAKVLLTYKELPNDWFATKLPLSIATGRVGCVLAGCCRGVPGDYPLGVVYSDGVPRFPAQMAELAFQLVAFGVAYTLYKRKALVGRLFAAYMVTYGVFRFFVEGLRDTRKLASGVSMYQLFSLLLVAFGAASFAWYSRALRERRA